MTTLVTGAGMIGSRAAQRIIDDFDDDVVLFDVGFNPLNLRDHVTSDRVTLRQGDITDLPDLLGAIDDSGAERIVHTAALVTSAVATRPYTGGRVNFLGTLSVLEAARLSGIDRVVQCSSSTVALGKTGLDGSEEMPEDFVMRVASESPPSLYASMKLACEWVGHCYSASYGMDVLTVRFAGVFGPWRGTPGGGPSKLFKSVIESTWRGEPVKLSRSDVEMPPRDYTYAPDGAQALAAAAFVSDPTQRVYNAAMGRLHDFEDLSAALSSCLDRKVEVDVQPSPPMQMYKNPTGAFSLRASMADLGYEVEFPLDRAVADYVDWLERGRG